MKTNNYVVVYSNPSPGVFLAHRNPGEPPFAKLRSPKASGGRKWTIIYRDREAVDPLGGNINSAHKNKKDAMYELQYMLSHGTAYQLGLSDAPGEEFK